MALLHKHPHQFMLSFHSSLTNRAWKVSSVCLVSRKDGRHASAQINALFNPQDDPIVKEALKEPLAFLGGVFAGVLRLDLTEDPLKEWIAKTSDAAGIGIDDQNVVEEEAPEEIQIE